MIKDYDFYGYKIKIDDSYKEPNLEKHVAGIIMEALLQLNNVASNVRKVDDKFAVNIEVDKFAIDESGVNDDPEKFGSAVVTEVIKKLEDSFLPFEVSISDTQVVDPRVNNSRLQALIVLTYTEPQDEKDQEIEKLKAKISKLEHPEFEADASVESGDK